MSVTSSGRSSTSSTVRCTSGRFAVIACAIRCSMIVLPAFGRRGDEAAGAEADGRDEVEDAADQLVGARLHDELLGRVGRGEVLEVGPARDRHRVGALERVDAREHPLHVADAGDALHERGRAAGASARRASAGPRRRRAGGGSCASDRAASRSPCPRTAGRPRPPRSPRAGPARRAAARRQAGRRSARARSAATRRGRRPEAHTGAALRQAAAAAPSAAPSRRRLPCPGWPGCPPDWPGVAVGGGGRLGLGGLRGPAHDRGRGLLVLAHAVSAPAAGDGSPRGASCVASGTASVRGLRGCRWPANRLPRSRRWRAAQSGVEASASSRSTGGPSPRRAKPTSLAAWRQPTS